ncbi:hypothetical protein [Massilioclostridium coli]|uniref:hypothetical protein n=1 Tax=Massilioclostridium coli TaxID=1870991 RepID=UPI00085BFE7C|nr:hypothetical protein [Massilioclostridium coli]
MSYILYTVILIAAVIGLVEIFGWIEQKIVFGKQKLNMVWILPLSGKIDNVELMVRNVINQARWNKNSKNSQIILLNMGMDVETEQICQMICQDMNHAQLYTQDEFQREIPEMFEQLAIVK